MVITRSGKRPASVDLTAQAGSQHKQRKKLVREQQNQTHSDTVSFLDILQRLRTTECHQILQPGPLSINACDDRGGTKYSIEAGNLVHWSPIVGGDIGDALKTEVLALVISVDAETGRIALCDGSVVYDDRDGPDEGLGCNLKLKVYSIDADGKLQHCSNNEFVEWDQLDLKTSKLTPGSYSTIYAITSHNFSKRREEDNMYWSQAHKRSELKKILRTDPLLDRFCELVDRIMHGGDVAPPLKRKAVLEDEESDEELEDAHSMNPADNVEVTPKKNQEPTSPDSLSDDDSLKLTKGNRTRTKTAALDDWEFAFCPQHHALYICHRLILEAIDEGWFFCLTGADGHSNLLEIRDKVLRGEYSGDDLDEGTFYMDVIGLCKSQNNMTSFFTDLFNKYKNSKVAIPSMVEVRHMIPSSYTFKNSDGTSVDIDLTPFRSCGYAKKSNLSSDQPDGVTSPHKLDSEPAQSQSSVRSPPTLESHVESDSHKSDAPPHKRPTLKYRGGKVRGLPVPSGVAGVDFNGDRTSDFTFPCQIPGGQNPNVMASQITVPQPSPNAKVGTADSNQMDAKVGTADIHTFGLETADTAGFGLPDPGPTLAGVFTEKQHPPFKSMFSSTSEMCLMGNELAVEFEEVFRSLIKVRPFEDGIRVPSIERYAITVDQLVGLPSALFAIKYCHLSNFRNHFEYSGATCSIFLEHLNSEFDTLKEKGNKEGQVTLIGNDVLTKLRATAARDLIHCIAYFGTIDSLMCSTNSIADTYVRVMKSQRFQHAIAANIATLFNLFNRWNPDAFPVHLSGSSTPFDMRGFITKEFKLRTIYETVLRFRSGLVSTWQGRLLNKNKPAKFIHHFACLAPFVLFSNDSNIKLDEGCEHFADVQSGLTFKDFKTYSLQLKLPKLPGKDASAGDTTAVRK